MEQLKRKNKKGKKENKNSLDQSQVYCIFTTVAIHVITPLTSESAKLSRDSVPLDLSMYILHPKQKCATKQGDFDV